MSESTRDGASTSEEFARALQRSLGGRGNRSTLPTEDSDPVLQILRAQRTRALSAGDVTTVLALGYLIEARALGTIDLKWDPLNGVVKAVGKGSN
jgi:hypothetical protein